ncbi:HlyD family efflux transporter periplasmic adaptor subunit [Vibrio sp. TH_r3]|uniref:HlyD family secretion protein n=1 Tax=Vibrio sp. TH_r3 TaxID=3082084 RepID=UPI0029556C95|nr:HlyD family efflux transporter periplasmic adaptor subunit [Vibrio sp. TH_r3]MDV7105619.1 HlyD family efflux transporter periplasmic adaptor subunit [Vibrio sp. TH_r3]
MDVIKYRNKLILIVLAIAVVIYILLLKEVEVVAPGTGLTGIKQSNVSVKAPTRSYIVELMVPPGNEVESGQPLLKYRNLEDEYRLQQISEELIQSEKLLNIYYNERCFLTGPQFASVNREKLDHNCDGHEPIATAGGLYILSFYEDYLLEQQYILDIEKERQRKQKELLNKQNILTKKKTALRRGNGATVSFYDVDTELSNVKTEVINFQISAIDAKKKLSDKLMVFQMRRSERLLTLEEQIDKIKPLITQAKYTKQLLEEKKLKSVIRSPIDGSILEVTEGLSPGTFVQEAAPLFVLKKKGASQQVEARFDSRYRHFLSIGRKVRLKINAPGFNQIFNGTIIELSSDSINYEEQGHQGKRYYRVTIQPDEEFLALSLDLGMDVQVFVVNDKVSVLEFILSVLPNDVKFEVW